MKTLIIFIADMLCVFFAFSLAWLFHINFDIALISPSSHAVTIGLVSLACYIVSFFVFSIPKVVWRYVSIKELVRLSLSIACGFSLSFLSTAALFHLNVEIVSILFLQAVFYMTALLLTRCVYRYSLIKRSESQQIQRVVIIGAGRAAENLIRDMLRHTADCRYRPVALLDDDHRLQGRLIHGVPVIGSCAELTSVIPKFAVDLVILAIPSLSDRYLLNHIFDTCSKSSCSVRVLPGLMDLADGKVTVDALRQVGIEDLLGREPINIHDESLSDRIANAVVWVTGGGGSIGSELSRQLAANQPKHLVIIENNEYNLYRISNELSESFPTVPLATLLVDVSDYSELKRVFCSHTPDIIFHASAYKHVPLLEDQVFSAIKNNVLATQSLCDLAVEFKIKHVVLVSTDKAVNPTNLMGMSKRMAEIYTQNINRRSVTRFSTVRFGNVLGSTGSVLPLFRQQLKAGGPLTITDPKMTRFFMMIPEAASLILQSFLLGEGGDIFVLDMGDPVNIKELAEKLITLSGKKPYVDVDIKTVGIRPGEKLYEELFYQTESLHSTPHAKIFKAQVREYDWSDVYGVFGSLKQSFNDKDLQKTISYLTTMVPEYPGQYLPSSLATIDTLV